MRYLQMILAIILLGTGAGITYGLWWPWFEAALPGGWTQEHVIQVAIRVGGFVVIWGIVYGLGFLFARDAMSGALNSTRRLLFLIGLAGVGVFWYTLARDLYYASMNGPTFEAAKAIGMAFPIAIKVALSLGAIYFWEVFWHYALPDMARKPKQPTLSDLDKMVGDNGG
jgi:hypothetical protein